MKQRVFKTKQKNEKSRKEPYWKRRIENNIKTWRNHLSKLAKVCKGSQELCEKDKEIIRKYELEATECINIISQLKVKVHNGGLKLKNYEIKREQFP